MAKRMPSGPPGLVKYIEHDRAKRKNQRKMGHELNRIRTNAAPDASFQTAREPRTGRRLGLTLVVPPTRLGYTNSYFVSTAIKRLMGPIRTAPIKIFNAAGRQVAVVVFNPVTGSRHRLPVPPFRQGDR